AARPVFVPAARIDPGTGGAAPASSRRDPALGMVRQIGSPGTSSALQLSGSLSWYYPRRAMVLTGGYAFTRARDEVAALSAPGGSQALAVDGGGLLRGPSDRDRTHDLEVRLTVGPRPWLRMGLLGRLTSAAPFTPRVDGDVNGDGAANDPAFVFSPAAPEPEVAAGMASLLESLPAGLRRCLERQAGRIAARNSCRVGMASSLDVRVDVQPWRKALDRRLLVTMATSNALALADRALHGAAALRGWGQSPAVDPVLLRVRGFDPARGAYRYEVNPAFGTRTASRATLSRPFALTIEARVTAGADPAAQPLQEMVSNMMGPGRTAEEIRFDLAKRIPNVAAQTAALDSAAGLRLTPQQKDTLAALAAAFGGRVAPLVDSLAMAQGAAEAAHSRAARQLWRQATARGEQVQRELMADVERVRQVLTPGQWSRLPAAVRMPSRQLVSARPVRPSAPSQ
ncbi:MAG TPA: hypothetical protein VFH27_01980, partial [Longimicrobiaceae bacterium]|nr:hypothetical protein [Longimicrobiaceae bacterium]